MSEELCNLEEYNKLFVDFDSRYFLLLGKDNVYMKKEKKDE